MIKRVFTILFFCLLGIALVRYASGRFDTLSESALDFQSLLQRFSNVQENVFDHLNTFGKLLSDLSYFLQNFSENISLGSLGWFGALLEAILKILLGFFNVILNLISAINSLLVGACSFIVSIIDLITSLILA